MCYLKNRRSGFSFMASSETVNQATISRDARFGILSKSGSDAKKMFTDKVVPISSNYPFFFKPIQDGMERPKTELSYKIPSRRLTRNSCAPQASEEDQQGVWTQQSTGRIQETTRMMGRNSDYLSTMNRVNGRNRTTYSTTGGSRKRV